jgi:OOP family OmpA-OmpF porin
MNLRLFATVFFTVVFSGIALSQEDAPGCKDSPMFTRMPNTLISQCSSNYDELSIPMGADKTETKEGTKTSIQYDYEKEEATAPSFFQIVKNFENAIVKTGGKRVYYSKDAGVATFFAKSGGKDVWVVLNDYSGAKAGNFELNILEIEAMKQDISASDMLEAINKNGSVSLQINFETGKSAIKPESQVIVDQIAEMLKTNPGLKVSIEGHTDNVGSAAANKTLSESRAKSVVASLVLKGIDKTRLSSKGWGQEKPVADNGTDEGKAKNRRVEIVKI